MTKIIGITGGIGSGKSVFSRVLRVMGYKVYDTDSAAKRLMRENESLKLQLTDIFGHNVYVDGDINRGYLAGMVFKDKSLLIKLNNTVHPVVEEDMTHWIDDNITENFLFIESAILIESGFIKRVDEAVNVEAPTELRIERVIKRDNVTREDVLRRINNQMSDEQREEYCRYRIFCDDKQSLIKQSLVLLKSIEE